jgi:hypothetical protein
MNEDSATMSLETIPPVVGQTAEERADWARRFRESGLSLRKFSAQHGLRWGSLYNWVRAREKALRKTESDTQVIEFTEMKIPEPIPATDWVAEIRFPDGKVLRVAKEAPAATLEQLLRVC